MNPQWRQQQQRQQFQAPQPYPQPTGFQPQSSFLSPASPPPTGFGPQSPFHSFASPPTGFGPNSFQRPPSAPPTGFGPNVFQRPPSAPPVPPLPSSFQQSQSTGFAPLLTQPTGFAQGPRMSMMHQTFMPANTSTPYGPGSTPQFAGPPQQAQGPSLQQSMQQHRNVEGGPIIPWALSKDERKRYDDIFRAWDPQGTGFISGKTASEVFGQSGLSQEDLSKIWVLADSTNRGSLNLPEFHVAMGLIYRGLNGTPIPTVLPPELVPPQERDLEDSVKFLKGILSKDSHERASNGSSPNPQYGKTRLLRGTPEIEAENSRTREDDELEDELHDLKYRVKRCQEDLDRTNRGPRNIRKDEERRRLERELIQLLHEKIPEVERKLEERETEKRRDRDRRDHRNVDSSRYGRDRSDRDDTPPPRSSSAVGGSTRPPPPTSSTLSITAWASAIPPSTAKMTPAEKAAFVKAEAQRRTQERMRALGVGTESPPARASSPPPG